jgi:hypothetical protein
MEGDGMTIPVVFDGKAFVPTEPVDLPAGTKACVAVLGGLSPATAIMTVAEADRILKGDGTPLPWATVDQALAYSRGRPWPEPDIEGQP